MEQKQQIIFPEQKSFTRLEVEAIIEEKIEPFQKAINPVEAPYLTVAHFLWFIGIMITLGTTIFGVIWSRINRGTERLHARVDKTNTEIEEREDKLRTEFTEKINRNEDRLWEIAIRTPPDGSTIKVIDKTK